MNNTISKKISELTSAIKANSLISIQEYKELTNSNNIHLMTNSIIGQQRILKQHINLLKKFDKVITAEANNGWILNNSTIHCNSNRIANGDELSVELKGSWSNGKGESHFPTIRISLKQIKSKTIIYITAPTENFVNHTHIALKDFNNYLKTI
jgi:hypothetical protein